VGIAGGVATGISGDEGQFLSSHFQGSYWAITPVALSELINKKRKQLNRTPIDHATMMTHLVLRSNVTHPDLFDFEASELKMNTMEILHMEVMLNDLFLVCLDKTLADHCKFQAIKNDKVIAITTAQQTPPQVAAQKRGLVSKPIRIFGR